MRPYDRVCASIETAGGRANGFAAALLLLIASWAEPGASAAVRCFQWIPVEGLEAPTANGTQQTATVVADLDGDGADDFAIAERRGTPSLVWYQRTADGWNRRVVDGQRLDIEAGGAAHDVDGDGDLDLVFGGDNRSSEVWWWENPAPDFSVSQWARRVIKSEGDRQHHDIGFADVDDDGDAEFVYWTANASERPTLWVAEVPPDPRDGGIWSTEAVWQGDEPAEGLDMADVDGNGVVDIVAGGRWFERTAEGAYVPHVIDVARTFGRVAVGQLRAGGRPEVVMVVGDRLDRFDIDGIGPLRWYEWDGQAWVGHDLLDVPAENNHSLQIADIDRDGNLDVFAAEMRLDGGNPDAGMWVFLGDGAGGFVRHDVAVGRDNHESRLGDLDGDGDLDIVGKPYNHDAPGLHVWLNGGTGRALDRWKRHLIDGAALYQPLFVEAADLDGDGLPDLIAGGFWYRNPGLAGGTWTRQAFGSPLHNALAVLDVDADGDRDVVGTRWRRGSDSGDDGFFWGRNDGAGNFEVLDAGTLTGAARTFLQGVAPGAFSLTEPDASAVALSWQGSEGGGIGVELLRIPTEAPDTADWVLDEIHPESQGEGLSAGDIDGDGDLDLFQGSWWLRNEGVAGWSRFQAAALPPELGLPDRNRLGDLDGDGDLDAIVGFAHYADDNAAGRTDLIWLEAPDDPTGAWTPHTIDTGVAGGWSVDLGDLDGDGDLDAVLGEHKGDTRLITYENAGAGEVWIRRVVDPGGPDIDHHDGARLHDVDRDGDLDIVSIGWYHDKLWLFENEAIDCLIEPPTPPRALQATPVASHRVDLTWEASTATAGIAAYRVYRDGVEVARVVETRWSDTGLAPSTQYGWSVAAEDNEGTLSLPSLTVFATTPTPDTVPPTAPTSLTATAMTPFRIALAWGPATDDRGVVGYRVYRDGLEVAQVEGGAYLDVGLAPATIYDYSVSSLDAEGNTSNPLLALVTAKTLSLMPVGGDPKAAFGFEEGGGERVYDLSGFANDGTLLGGERTPGGRYGDGLALQGPSDGIDLGGLDLPGTGVTLAAWVRVDSFERADARLISKANGVDEQDHWWMLSTFTDGALRFRLKTAEGGTATVVSAPQVLALATWTHVAATWDGETMTVHRDGVAVGSGVHVGALAVDPAVPAWIGNNPVGERVLDGVIDEVWLFDRALSAPELDALMQTPVGPLAECGNGVVEPGEQCDDGPGNSDVQADACRRDCSLPVCGDGVRDFGEACDDGNAATGDGCAPDCQLDLDPELAAVWMFEEGGGTAVIDATGQGHDGELAGGSGRDAQGFFGAALETDGADGRVQVDGPSVEGEGLTVALWFRADDFQIFDARLIARAAGAEPDHAVWELATVGPRLQARLRTVSGTTSLTATGATLLPNVWTHAMLVYDGERLTLYQDGQAVRSTARSGPLADDPAAVVWIGNRPGGGKAFDGKIDDVRVYRRAIGLAEFESVLTQPVVEPPVCGDGQVQFGEDCDDGNDVEFDGCDTTCLTTLSLRLARGPFPGQITLAWAGGRPAFRVHRGVDPGSVGSPSTVIAETSTALWTETPPPGQVLYYRVQSRP